jgi:hypothetical protein
MRKVATRDTYVVHVCHVVRLFSLARCLLIQISATPSDMGEACSLLSFRRSAIPLCSHESFGYVNYDYLVVKNDDTKK